MQQLPPLEHVKISSITFGDRFRKEYNKEQMEELKSSMSSSTGQICPIAIQRQSDGTFLLCAGGRRLKAAIELNWDTIAARIYEEGDELDLRLIELLENICRADLDWKERLALTEETHRLQQAKYGTRNDNGEKGWSIRDTAELIGVGKSKVQEDIKLSELIRERPKLFEECKNRKDAQITVQKLVKKIEGVKAAMDFQKSIKDGSVDTGLQLLLNSYVIKDCIEGMSGMADESFDFAEIDPPYNLDLSFALEITKKQEEDLMSPGFSTPEQYISFMRIVLNEVYRLLKPNSAFVLWHPDDFKSNHQTAFWQILNEIGFSVVARTGKWIKTAAPGVTCQPDRILGNCYESFFYGYKGQFKLNKPGVRNTFLFDQVPAQKKVHPTERPIEMIQSILETFVPPGSNILIPFLGSGNTILSAYNANMMAIGFDKSDEYISTYQLKVKDGYQSGFRSLQNKERK